MDKERTTNRKCCQNVKPTLKTVTLTLRSNISKMSQMGMPPSTEHNKRCMRTREKTGAEVTECTVRDRPGAHRQL